MTSYDPFPEKLPSITMLNQQGNNDNHSHQDIALSNFASNPGLYTSNPNATTNDMSFDLYNQQHLSPPLTPAVSPTNMMDPTQFKRTYSVNSGPFGLNTHPSLVHDQDGYRRSSCSAMSVDDSMQPQSPLHQQHCHSLQQQMIHHHHDQQQQQQQANYYHHHQPYHQSTQHDNSSYLIGDSLSLSGDIGNALSTGYDAVNINNDTTTKFSKRTRLGQQYQQGPNAPHKHVCKYSECGWSFKRYEHLKRHMLVHTGERPHVCTFPGCGKSFSRSDNFHAHFRTHTKKRQSGSQSSCRSSNIDDGSPPSGDIVMPMTISPSSSPSSQQDLAHGYNSSHPFVFNSNNSNRPFEMPYQDVYDQRSFTNEVQDQYSSITSPQSYMRMGMTSHSGVSSLLNHDESSPMFASNVMTPIYDYTGFHSTTGSSSVPPPPSTPNYSPSMPSSPGSMKKQRKCRTSPSHSLSSNSNSSAINTAGIMQQKSHFCPMAQCQRRFKRLEHLKRHMRIHTLERPFACTFPKCHKRFSRSDNLSQHMKTHQHRPGQDKRRKSSITNTIDTSSSSSVSPRSDTDDFASTNPSHYSYSITDTTTSALPPSWALSESVGC